MHLRFLPRHGLNVDQVLEQIVAQDPGTYRRCGCAAEGTYF